MTTQTRKSITTLFTSFSDITANGGQINEEFYNDLLIYIQDAGVDTRKSKIQFSTLEDAANRLFWATSDKDFNAKLQRCGYVLEQINDYVGC